MHRRNLSASVRPSTGAGRPLGLRRPWPFFPPSALPRFCCTAVAALVLVVSRRGHALIAQTIISPRPREAITRPNLLQLLSLWPKVKTSGVGMGNDRIAQRIRNVINNAQRVPAPLTLHRRRQTQKLHLGSGERVRLGIRPDV